MKDTSKAKTRQRFTVKRGVIFAALGVVTILGGVTAFFYLNRDSNESAPGQGAETANVYTDLADEIQAAEPIGDTSPEGFIETYSGDYEEARESLLGVRPADWTSEQVGQVYFIIAYSEKFDEYRTMEELLDQLDQAAEAGVVIDGSGKDKAYRDELRTRVDAGYATLRENAQ